MKNPLLIVITLFFISLSITAQNNPYILQFKTGEVIPKENIKDIDPRSESFDETFFKGHYYILLQFNKLPSESEVKELERAGVELLSYIPSYAYLAKIERKTFLNDQNWKKKIRHISAYLPLFKISPVIYEADEEIYVSVLFQEEIKEETAKAILKNNYLVWDQFYSNRVAKLKIKKSKVESITNHPLINYISLTSKDFNPLIKESKETSRVGRAKHNLGFNLTGNGVTVSVGDGGTIYNHIDLNDRIQNENLVDISSHGSQTASIVAGEGLLDPKAEGYAPGALVYADFFSGVINNDDAYYTTFNVVISNNSYSDNVQTTLCNEVGEYTVESVDVDQSLRTLTEVTHVFSAGNDGNSTCGAYPSGYSTIRESWNCAKNTLTVGSTDYLDNISSFSSRGPTQDGRMKPEMVAVGSSVYAASTSNNYTTGSGTSFSAPAVSGALALLYEQYKNINGGTTPRGDLMKAIVLNTSRDLGNIGPDYIFGYGALDMHRATSVISTGRHTTGSIANGGSNTHNIVVPAGANQLKVMLYWHDKEGTAAVNPNLVNNLDLSVDDPSSTNILPLVLDPSAANCANIAVQGVDNINNVEQVTINNPAPGTFTINIDGAAIPMGTQDYVIVYDIIEDHLSLSSPIGGELYQTGEDINITWNAAGFNANDFTLEYSLENGTNWTTISSTIPGTDRNYEWTTPSTFTEEGLVRISWNSTGLAMDQSLSNFTIMDAPISITLTPECNGDMKMVFGNVTGAASYDILEYTGGAWTVFASDITSPYTTSALTIGTEYYFSVRAVSTSGIVGPHTRGQSTTPVGSLAGSISTYPYLEDFETDHGDWITYGKNNSWAWGTPSNIIINRAAKGINAWTTNPGDNYNNVELSYLTSPCFDLSSITNPVFAFAFNLDIEDANDGFGSPFYDIARVEYSTNGRTWTTLGTNGSGHNWYNNYMGENAWDDTKGYWHSASHTIPVTSSRVYFRFVFDSDGFVTQEGLSVDNISIYEAEDIYNGANTNVTQSVSGTDWLHFESGGNRIISINPNGNNLGSTSANVYINTGTLRDDSEQYYLDRNWKITPTTAPVSNVSVRLYFSDAEVEDLRAAAGACPTCTTITDAFLAGITKYSGVGENGNLSDNASLAYSFFSPYNVEVVPFSDGYYVEFDTPSFSEFYINGGNISLPVELIDFTLTKDGEDAILKWLTSSEVNADRFEIEVARGQDQTFTTIGSVNAIGNSSEANSYIFKDMESNKSGLRYYRLRMIDIDNSFEYSETKVLEFDKLYEWDIYPNPNKGNFTVEVKSNASSSVSFRLTDQLGRVLFNQDIELQKGINNLNIANQLNLSEGYYQLEMIIGGKSYVEKVIIIK
ncbi:MAG: subtilisin family serine protease [Maribacter sp.]|jgi:subtilisin family serine protease